LTDETGSGANVFATSPTLVTPILGTPTSATLTNATGLPLTTGVTGTLPTANGGTNLTSFTSGGVVYASSSSALATGSGLVYDGNSLSINNTVSRTLNVNTTGANGVGVALQNSASDFGYIGSAKWVFGGSLNDVGIGTSGATNLVFGNAGVEGLRLTSTSLYTASGINVGIGTSSPAALLDVDKSQNAATSIRVVNTNAGSSALSRSIVTSDGGNIQVKAMSTANTTYGVGNVGVINCDTMSNGLLFSHNDSVKMTLSFAGNLGLGVTPSSWQSSLTPIQGLGYSLYSATATQVRLSANEYFNAGSIYRSTGVATLYQQSSGEHQFFTAASGTAGNAISFTQAMTLTAAGNLLVGTTSGITNGGFSFEPDYNGAGISAAFFGHSSSGGSGNQYCVFAYNGTFIGSIAQTGTTGVLYNVTSDQRLKENIQDADSASSLIDSLQVRKFDWKSDSSHQRYGFIAQELVTVAPEAVHQPADPDEMMAVDYSKLVPMLVKEIQSLRQRLSAANL
jgi:hypothetical protein